MAIAKENHDGETEKAGMYSQQTHGALSHTLALFHTLALSFTHTPCFSNQSRRSLRNIALGQAGMEDGGRREEGGRGEKWEGEGRGGVGSGGRMEGGEVGRKRKEGK